MTKSLYSILLILIHKIYSVIEIFVETWVYLKTKWCHEYNHKEELEIINTNIKRLPKIPSHVVVILGTEQPSFNDLASLIFWCLASGISYVTFYDHNGFIKKTENELYNAFIEKRKTSAEFVNWGNLQVNGYKKNNHFDSSSKKIQVNVFSLSDGHGKIVNLTKSLASTVQSREIDINLIDKYLFSSFKIPEPEMAVYCGKVCSTYGFLPWHIRVTEFFRLRTHRNVAVTEFVDLLMKYAKCEQRFGQ